MNIEIWIDPACPFCWTTAKWIVEDVQPNRDLEIAWRPISLFFKNSPGPESPYYEPSVFSHGLLRIMESIRTTNGNEGVFGFYWESGTRIHHDKTQTFDPGEALVAAGLDLSHGDAFEDETWDSLIRSSMDEALVLAGDDVGTPIIAATNNDNVKNGYFGPVISHAPELKAGLAMWDGLIAMMSVDSFFELKRTRTEAPDPGKRPVLKS